MRPGLSTEARPAKKVFFPETGNWKPKTENWKLETGNRQPSVRRPAWRREKFFLPPLDIPAAWITLTVLALSACEC